MAKRHSATVAIIGAGASGTLAAIQLLRRAESADTLVDLRLIDPSPTTGRGVAYGTGDPSHLLNVRASRMGAVATEPGHFCRWLERTKGVSDADAFVPRSWFGEYLDQSLSEAVASSRSRVERIRAKATEIHRREVDSTVRLDDGRRFRASHVILALGGPSGPNQLLPTSLLCSPRFIADPWAVGVLDEVARAGGDVLLLGTGLTTVDVALRINRPDRTITAISRRGLLPASHAVDATRALDPPPLPSGPLSLEDLEALVLAHVERAVNGGACWQDAVDSLRPVTNELWSRLSPPDQARFIAGPMRAWEVARHRMAPDVAERFTQLIRSGSVVLGVGEVTSAVETADGIEVCFADGTIRRASSVISCTGPTSVRASVGPLSDLAHNLEHQGVAILHPSGLGFIVDEVGRLRAANGELSPPIYLVGALRRGSLFETTAVPEILGQGDEVARHIVACTRTSRRPGRPQDLYGETLTTTGAAADLFNEGLGRLLRVQSGAVEAIQRSVEVDPAFALGHATLAMLGHEFDLDIEVGEHLAFAQRPSSAGVTRRERSFIQAIHSRIEGDSSPLIHHVEAHPLDVLAISVAMPTIAFSGAYDVSNDAWDLLDRLAPRYDDDWWINGLLAFARQEQGHYDEAHELAQRSLAVEPRAGIAAHALAHVYLEKGEHRAGIDWIDRWITTAGRDATHLAHFSWHAALFELALDDTEAVLARLRRQLTPKVVRGTRAMVDTATLLWRLQLEDEITCTEAHELLEAAGPELWQPSTAFSAMHAAFTWAVIGDMAGLHHFELRCRSSASALIASVVAPLAAALRLFLIGSPDDAATVLLGLLPHLDRLGGSAAQRAVVEDTAVAALIRAGDGALAGSLLSQRLERRARPKDVVMKERARLATALPHH